MIRVTRAPEPAQFDLTVRQPGLRAIAEMVGAPGLSKRSGPARQQIADSPEAIPAAQFPPYWRDALPDLLNAYGRVCAYSSFYIDPITGAASVDHMLPKSQAWQEVYEWRNYRLACSLMNSRKNDYQDVLDPFEVEDDWFRIELVGYQVIPAPGLAPEIHRKVSDTINRLKLNDHDCLTLREEYAKVFAMGNNLQSLSYRAPFLAREITRHQAKAGPST
jgi:hypothetical protein